MNHYGLSGNLVLESSGNSYVLNAGDQSLYFDDFLWKISPEKYILVSDEIRMDFVEGDTKTYNGYVELQYYNEGILRIINQDNELRTVSSDCIASLSNGVMLDLADHTILKSDGTNLSMEQMTIGADDAIDVLAPIKNANAINDSQLAKGIDVKVPTFEVIDGEDGAAGVNGEAGEAGINGDDGEEGEAGEKGVAGTDGEQGEEGTKGETGKIGTSGEKGNNGLEGNDGESGTPGNPGEAGTPGTSGTSGATGANGITGKSGAVGPNGANGGNGGSGAAGAAGANGAIGANGIDGNDLLASEIGQQPPESEQINNVLPIFELVSIEASSNTVQGQIKITDENGVLDITSPIVISVIQTSSGIEYARQESDATDLLLYFNFDSLLSDTEYKLMVKAKYNIQDSNYERVFLTKTFITTSIGLTFEKLYATEDTLAFKVYKKEYSHVIDASLKISDMNGNAIETIGVNISNASTEEGDTVIFKSSLSNPIQSNTFYKIALTNIQNDSAIGTGVIHNYAESKVQTLKKKPVIGKPIVVVNKVDGVFDLQTSSVKDDDLGIQYYKYEIYQCDSFGTPAIMDPVKTVLTTENGVVPCNVDDITLFRNRYYKARVVSVFNDNEKEVEYSSEFSDVFGMAGTRHPEVEFIKDETDSHHDRIAGDLIIRTYGATIKATAENPLIVQYQNSRGNVDSINFTSLTGPIMASEDNSKYTIPFNVNNLLKDDDYIISVYSMVDLNDGMGEQRGLLGSVVVHTNRPRAFRANISPSKQDGKQIGFKLNLSDYKVSESSAYEASTLAFLQINIYNGDASTINDTAPVATYVMTGENGENNASTLADKIYGEHEAELNESIMGINPVLITASQYTVQVKAVKDYTRYANEFELLESDPVTIIKGVKEPSIEDIDPNDGLTIIPIKNAYADAYSSYGASVNGSINGDAIIGFEVKAKFDNTSNWADQFIYYVYEKATIPSVGAAASFYATSNDSLLLAKKEVDVELGGASVPSAVFLFKDYEKMNRGSKYIFTYRARQKENPENYFPECKDVNCVVRSKEALAPYIRPQFYSMPWDSDNTHCTYHYYIEAKDVDAVYGGAFEVNETIMGDLPIQINQNNAELKIPVSGRGPLKVVVYANDYNKNYYGENRYHVNLVNQYYSPLLGDISNAFSYNAIDIETENRIKLTVTDSDVNATNLKKVVALQVDLYNASDVQQKSLKIPFSSITNNVGEAYVNYSNFQDLINNTLKFKVSVLVDNGRSGFGIVKTATQNVAIQTVTTEPDGKYVTLNTTHDGVIVNDSGKAMNSYFSVSQANVTPSTTQLYYSSCLFASFQNEMMDLSSIPGGMQLGNLTERNIVTLKGLNTYGIQYKKNNNYFDYFEITFQSMTPSINLNQGDSYTIIATADTATVNWKLYGQASALDNGKVQDQLMYMDLYEIKQDATRALLTEKKVSTFIEKDKEDYTTVITGLVNNKKYGITIYYIDQFTGKKVYPLDINRPNVSGDSIMFTFTTSDEVMITPATAVYSAETYLEKYITVPYLVNSTMGYKIVFNLYKKNGDAYETLLNSIDLANRSIILSPNVIHEMNEANLYFRPGSIVWKDADSNDVYFPFKSNDIYLGIKPVSLVDPSAEIGKEQYAPLFLKELKLPYYNVVSIPYSPTRIDYKVTVTDVDRVIVGNHFRVKVFDALGNDVTPETIKSTTYSTFQPNRISVDGLDQSGAYTLKIYTIYDRMNVGNVDGISGTMYENLNDAQCVYQITAKPLSDKGYDMGAITFALDQQNRGKLYFKDSVGLEDKIRYLQYTIVDPYGKTSSYTDYFNLIDVDESKKVKELYHTFESTGEYVIQLRFMDENMESIHEDTSLTIIKEY